MPLVLGVDSSTQATKIEIRDADDGRLVAEGRAPHPATTPPCSEQDPRKWWDALAAAIGDAGDHAIAAIAVAAQQHGLVVLDRASDVVRPAKLWNDGESAPQAASLVRERGADWWARACGSVPLAAFTVTKLRWLQEREPASFARVQRILLPHDYLTFRLTNCFVTDRGDASGTGYWSPALGAWRPDVLDDVLGPPATGSWLDRLPHVAGPGDAVGELTAAALDHLGLRGTILCAPGTGDNMAAALGMGLRAGDVAISLGTSGTVFSVSDRPTQDASGAVAGFADATGRFLPLVCTLNATQVTDAFARLLGVGVEQLGHMAAAARPGASGVVVLPYLSGERTPNRPDATGRVDGIRVDTDREQLARAAFEGVTCGLLDGLDALEQHVDVVASGRTMLVGGGARSSAYQRIVADLSGRTLTLPNGREHVATGACVQAAACLTGSNMTDIATRWGLGDGTSVAPDQRVDRVAIRRRYASVRDG